MKIFIFFSILIFALSVFSIQNAHAADKTFAEDTTISSDAIITAGDIWIINPGVTVTIDVGVFLTIEDGGQLIIEGLSSSLFNYGNIDNDGLIKVAHITDSNNFAYGINNFGSIYNSGTITIMGETNGIANFDALTNSGIITISDTNTGLQNEGTVTNTNTGLLTTSASERGIRNISLLENYGTIIVESNGDDWLGSDVVNPSGTIINFGAMIIHGNVHNNETSPMADPGTMINNGVITISENGMIRGFDSSVLTNSNTINIGPDGKLVTENGSIINSGTINRMCQSYFGVISGGITGNPVYEIPCIPDIISPSDDSSTFDTTPAMFWEYTSEVFRTVIFDVTLEDISNPGVPIELDSVEIASPNQYYVKPLSDLPDGNFKWSVRANVNPVNENPYSFVYVTSTSPIFSFEVLSPRIDIDGDGFSPPVDCDDENSNTFQGAPELRDGIDNNCNGGIDEGLEEPLLLTGEFTGIYNNNSWKSTGKYAIDEDEFEKIRASGTFSESEAGSCNEINVDGTIQLPHGTIDVIFDLQQCNSLEHSGTVEVTGGTGNYEGFIGSGDATIIDSKKLLVGNLSVLLKSE